MCVCVINAWIRNPLLPQKRNQPSLPNYTDNMVLLFLLVAYALVPLLCNGDEISPADIINGGYGVNFIRVGSIPTSGSLTYGQKTRAIKWPDLQYKQVPLMDCGSAIDWRKTCNTINHLIIGTNTNTHDLISRATRMLHAASLIVPFVRTQATTNETTNEQHESITRNHDPIAQNYPRSKRDVSNAGPHDDDDDDEIDDADLPDWLKTDPSDVAADFWPGNAMGQFIADIFHRPGPHTKRKLREHIRVFGKGIYSNQKSIAHFDSAITAFSINENK